MNYINHRHQLNYLSDFGPFRENSVQISEFLEDGGIGNYYGYLSDNAEIPDWPPINNVHSRAPMTTKVTKAFD
jgi:hypothetical protein